jgi:hypothetical protein
LVFGVYQLALHHSTVNAIDAVEGRKVVDAKLIACLLEVSHTDDVMNILQCLEPGLACRVEGGSPQ